MSSISFTHFSVMLKKDSEGKPPLPGSDRFLCPYLGCVWVDYLRKFGTWALDGISSIDVLRERASGLWGRLQRVSLHAVGVFLDLEPRHPIRLSVGERRRPAWRGVQRSTGCSCNASRSRPTSLEETWQ